MVVVCMVCVVLFFAPLGCGWSAESLILRFLLPSMYALK